MVRLLQPWEKVMKLRTFSEGTLLCPFRSSVLVHTLTISLALSL